MPTSDNDTVIDKAVNLVKDVFGIRHDAPAEPEPDFKDTEPEVTAEHAMSLDPNVFVVSPSGQVTPGTAPSGETDAERLRREVGEEHRPSPLGYGNEIVRQENGV